MKYFDQDPPRDLGAEMLEEMKKGRQWTEDLNRQRDFFAAAALQGLLSSIGTYSTIADDAYTLADAMLEARRRA